MKLCLRGLVLMLLLLSSKQSSADPRLWGIDYLGGAKYGSEIAKSHPDNFAIGIFTQKDLFGDAYPVLDSVLASKKVPLVRYNLRWSDSHTFSRQDFPKIVAEAKRFVPLVEKYPNVECQFSGATEHNLNKQDATDLAIEVLKVIPQRCEYVNNPLESRGAFITPGVRILNEVHGGKTRRPRVGGRYVYSFDGTDAFDVNVTAIKNRFHDADVFFMWTSQNNGRRNVADNTPRPQRKFWPTGDLIRMQAFLATSEGSVSLDRSMLHKPKSDQHVTPPASRELKPVFIVGTDAQRIEFVSDSGKVIATSGSRMPFADGRSRYYLPDYGYKIANKAIEVHGKPTVNVRVKGKVVGIINPGFRAGVFR
jgi:hypothetical protein